jgi:hypothetical protein
VAARVASGLVVKRAGVGCCPGKVGRGVARRAGSSARTPGGRAGAVGHLGAAWWLGAARLPGGVARLLGWRAGESVGRGLGGKAGADRSASWQRAW